MFLWNVSSYKSHTVSHHRRWYSSTIRTVYNILWCILFLYFAEDCEVSGGGGSLTDNSGAMKRRWSSESSDSNSRLGPGPTTTTAPTPSPSLPSTTAPVAKQPRKSVPGWIFQQLQLIKFMLFYFTRWWYNLLWTKCNGYSKKSILPKTRIEGVWHTVGVDGMSCYICYVQCCCFLYPECICMR
jgi:hypothetical protein